MSLSCKENPLVSIVIPCYNHAQFVQETIQSVIDQDYENIELIIIDDGSKDNSVEVIKEMLPACEERFARFEFRYRPNKGLCATLNEALQWCEGEFFSPIASDDIALSHKTSFLVDKIKNSDYAAVFGTLRNLDDINNKNIESLIHCEHDFESLMLQVNTPAAPAAMLRKKSIIEVGGYAEDINIEDRYMWLLLTSNNKKLATFSEVLVLYRRHDGNTVNDTVKMHKARIKVLNKFKAYSIYRKSIKNEYVNYSKWLANTKILIPIKIIIMSNNFNRNGFFVIIKALTPNFIIDFFKKWHTN